MHPILFRLGSFEMGTYGVLLAAGFFAALYLARRQGRFEGIDPEAITDLSVVLLLAGILGSKLLMIVVDLAKGVPPSQVFDLATLRAGGAIHGGIIGGVVAFFWRIRKLKLPLARTVDALVPAVALGQGLGRLGCLAAGCCYGTECHLPWAITFTNPEAFQISGTPLGQPLHPVQFYTLLGNLTVMALLLLLRRHRRFPGQLMALYFVLEGLARILVESWRGDLDRGVWMGLSWLSTGRLTALGFILFGAVLAWWFARRRAA
jgi:phosphatidylglycerol---prolipoprotein diacylglyceryl transferase